MKTITILMDSLNRHRLSLYGGPVPVPNLERLAAKGVRFTRHYAASLPCMPARRDLMTGRYTFLESGWGPMEPWDESCIANLRERGIYTHMITDHYHYFQVGGENYHTQYHSWVFERGQEFDCWADFAGGNQIPLTSEKRQNARRYWANRSRLDVEDENAYPTARCFREAADFVRRNAAADNWHLHLEVFDPHEPFDCPASWLKKAGDTYDRERIYNWPNYGPVGSDGDDAVDRRHIEARYAGSLMMADHHLGMVIDAIDATESWDDTCIILTSDHGYLLGEHGYWAKNYVFDYEELTHIPLVIVHPDAIPGSICNALSSAIDMAPTLCELHDAQPLKHAHGASLLDLVLQRRETLHERVLTGYFAKDISITDGHTTYVRQPLADSMAYHHTLMPGNVRELEYGDWLPQAEGLKLFRIPTKSYRHHDAPDHHLLYDLVNDPRQTTPVVDDQLESIWAERLTHELAAVGAPAWQFARVGLERPAD